MNDEHDPQGTPPPSEPDPPPSAPPPADTPRAAGTDSVSVPPLRWRHVGIAAGVTLIVAFALRLWTLAAMDGANPLFGDPILDEAEYLSIARTFASGDHLPDGWYLAPLYPQILAWLGIDTAHAARLLNAVVGSITAALTAGGAVWLTRSLRAGLLAGACVALPGALVLIDVTVANEPLLTLLGLGAVLLCAAPQLSAPGRAVGGLLAGCAAVARANALGTLAALVGGWRAQRSATSDTGAASTSLPAWLAAPLLGALLALAVAAAANGGPRGEASPFAWGGGLNVWLGNNPYARSQVSYGARDIPNDPIGQRKVALSKALAELGADAGNSAVSGWWIDRARDDALERPGAALAHLARKLGLVLTADEIGGNHDVIVERRFAPWTAWFPVGVWWVLALGVGGWWTARRRHPWVDGVAAACAVHMVTIVLVFPLSRYRLPMIPWCALAVAAGVETLLARDASRRRALTAAVAIIACGVVAFLPLRSSVRPESWANLGLAAWRQKRPEARAWLEQAVREGPFLGGPRLALGDLALVEGDAETARRQFEIAAAWPPTRRAGTWGLARALSNLGLHTDALAYNTRMRADTPDDAELVAESAQLLWRAGRRDEARAQLELARRIDASHRHVRETAQLLGQ